ncbi:MAG: 6-bladed beta-propeller [Gemmatimonadota bacterium]
MDHERVGVRRPRRPGKAWIALSAMTLAGPLAAQGTVELPGRDRALEVTLEEVFSVGTFDGADWETFGEIRRVGFDGAGNLYVMDVQSARMIVVDRNGEFVRTFGTRGEGPGEWRQPANAAVLRDGGVVVADMGHRAYQIYDPMGDYVGSARMGSGAVTVVGDVQADPRGGAVFNGGGSTMMSVEAQGGAEPQLPQGRPIQRVALEDGAGEEVFYDAWMPPRPAPRQMSAGGWGSGWPWGVHGASSLACTRRFFPTGGWRWSTRRPGW